jgi:hypothetical protein
VWGTAAEEGARGDRDSRVGRWALWAGPAAGRSCTNRRLCILTAWPRGGEGCPTIEVQRAGRANGLWHVMFEHYCVDLP